MRGKQLSQEEKFDIIDKYQNSDTGIEALTKIFGVGKLKIKDVLIEANIEFKKKGNQSKNNYIELTDNYKLIIFESETGEYIATCKQTGKVFKDANNYSGALTAHLKTLHPEIEIPANTYLNKRYELEHGKKWYEDYFDIQEVDKKEVVKCCLCDWETYDLTNKTGSLTKHITNDHDMTILEYTEQFPSEKKYWETSFLYDKTINSQDDSVVCLECGERFIGLTHTHLLNKHDMNFDEYKYKHGYDIQVFSNTTSEMISEQTKQMNATRENCFVSKPQLEINDFIKDLGFETKLNNKSELKGVELDILVVNKNIAIEFNGLYYHSESMGKTKNYHLDKTLLSEKNNIKLIHIFEDEWVFKKHIVKERLKTILGVNNNKIYARKCIIKEINTEIKNNFLNEIHIQGSDNSSVRLGAYYNDELVGVMTFSKLRKVLGSTNKSDSEYELLRFSSKSVVGLVSKFLKYFIKNYNPTKIISYADRRWSPFSNDCVYTKVGFKFIGETKPNYWYMRNYKTREYRYNYRKDILVSKGYDINKTEFQIMDSLGFQRIWDCGSFKFEMVL
jgi:predicted transcriptional regulator